MRIGLLAFIFSIFCGKIFANPTNYYGEPAPNAFTSFCEISETDLFRIGETTFQDFDSDGDQDLLVQYDGNSSGFRIYLNEGAPDFKFTEKTIDFLQSHPNWRPSVNKEEQTLLSTAGNTGPYAVGMPVQLFASHGLSWSWTGPNGFTSTLQNPTLPSATTAMTGTYSVNVTLPGSVVESASTVLTVNPTVNLCHADLAHVFSIASVPTATSYTWSLDGSTTNPAITSGQGSVSVVVNLSGLSNGVHLLTVIANGATCSSFPTGLSFNLPPILTITATNTGTYCTGGTVAITSVPVGGVSPYTYAWSGPVPVTTATSQNPTIANATTAATGTYSVTVTDANGCTAVTTTNVSVVPDPTVVVTPTDATICAGATTTVGTSISGGSGTPTYAWASSASAGGPFTAVGGNTAILNTGALGATTFYQVTITQSGIGCTVLGTANVQVVPVPSVVVTGLTPTICTGGGDTLTANVSSGTGAITYVWEFSANGTSGWTAFSPAQTNQVLIVSNVTVTTFYRVLATRAGNGCGTAISPVMQLTVVADPTITVSGVNNICAGGRDTLTAVGANGTGTCVVKWQSSTTIGGTYTDIAGAIGNTYIIQPSSTPSSNTVGTTYYRALYTCNGVDCQTGISNIMTSVISDEPVTSNPVGFPLCIGGSITLTSTATGGTGAFTYQWQSSVDGTNSWTNVSNGTGGTTTNYQPVTTAAGTFYYRMLANQIVSGCNQAISDTAIVTIIALPTVSISGLTPTICTGGGDTLTANISNGVGAITYQWQSKIGAAAFANISGATSQQLIVMNVTATTDYRVIITRAGSGCGTAQSTPVTLTVVADPTISISGVNNICKDGADTLTAVAGNGTGACVILWDRSVDGTNWVSTGITGTTYFINTSSTPSTSTAGTTYYRARYSCNGVDCQTGVSNTQISVVAADPIITTAPVGDTVCQNGPTSISVVAGLGTGAFTYQWEVSNTLAGTYSATGTNSPTLVPVTSALGSKFYRVVITQTASGCNAITSGIVQILVKPVPTVTIAGATIICTGGGATLTSSLGTGTGTGTPSYQWQVFNTGTSVWDNLGATTATLSVTNLTVSRDYRLLVNYTGSGCAQAISNTQTITVVNDPAITVNYATPADDTLCNGSSANLTASVSNGAGGCVIQWQSFNVGTSTWTNIAGANAAAFNTGALTTTTSFRATYTCAASGCDPAVSNVLIVVVIPFPVVAVAPPPSICPGQSATVTANLAGNGTLTASDFNFQWQLSTDNTTWTNITGATAQSYTANYLVTTTYFRVIVTRKQFPCVSTSSSAQVTVLPAPNKPGPISY